MKGRTWTGENISNRTTTKNFTEETDEAEFVRHFNSFHMLMRIMCLRPFGPDMLAMRTKWNHAKLYGSFAALWFFLMEKDESEKGEPEPLPGWPSLCCKSSSKIRLS